MQVLVIGDPSVFRQGLASVLRQWPAVSSGLQAGDGELALGLVIGANPTSNHLVAATWLKNAAAGGSRIVMRDPRRTDLSRHAWRTLQFKPDTDVALPNAMIPTVVDKGLTGPVFLRDRASSFDTLKANVSGNRPELMVPVCGIPTEEIREVARTRCAARTMCKAPATPA